MTAVNEHGQRIYKPDGRVLRDYLRDDREVVVIRGPLGSGTSSASCIKLFTLMIGMPKCSDGIRRSSWIVVRNTYSQLRDTTLKTWRNWFPEKLYGEVKLSRPMVHEMRWADVEADVYFIALDSPEDVQKLRSLEITGGWINELEFIDKILFTEAKSRCGRYPTQADVDHAPFWKGLIADMNAPSEEHWLPMMTGEVPYPEEVPDHKREPWPDVWGYHIQPSALLETKGPDGKWDGTYRINPETENLRWLPGGYYEDNIRGNTRDWIRSRLMNQIVTVVDGDPVWPMFNRETHVVAKPFEFNPAYGVVVSLDFGRRPTAIIAQDINRRVQVQRELRDYGVRAATFAPALKRFLAEHYPRATIRYTGDPKGQDRGQADERTAYDIFRAHGMPITPAPVKGNAIETRIEVVAYALQQAPMGHSRILVSSQGCPTLVAGMAGKYHLKKTDGIAEPVKDKYSDPCDCLGYLLIFLGDGREMVGRPAKGRGRIPPKIRPFNLRRVS